MKLSSTLEELEGDRWGEPPSQSHLVSECHRLRKVPLGLLTIENLRIMLGRNIGTRYLLPIALEHLEADPFVEGDFRVAAVAARAVAVSSASACEHGPVVAAIRKAHEAFQQSV